MKARAKCTNCGWEPRNPIQGSDEAMVILQAKALHRKGCDNPNIVIEETSD